MTYLNRDKCLKQLVNTSATGMPTVLPIVKDLWPGKMRFLLISLLPLKIIAASA